MDFLTPTTELEAINIMLGAIGESPVNSLRDQMVVDVVTARAILNEVNKEVQSEGWHFNVEIKYPLPPNLKGEVAVPRNCLRIEGTSGITSADVVLRGNRLYDRIKHTYLFTATQYVDMLVLLPFEEIPEAARRYITIRATRIFQDRTVGSDTLHGFNQRDEAHARAVLCGTEAETADYHILDGMG